MRTQIKLAALPFALLLLTSCKVFQSQTSASKAESSSALGKYLGDSILATELNKLQIAEKECHYTDYELSQMFPEKATGPMKEFRLPDGTRVKGKDLDNGFKAKADKIRAKACVDMQKLSTVISSVQAKAISECSARGMETKPVWAISEEALENFSKYSDGEAPDLNYDKGCEKTKDCVREEYSSQDLAEAAMNGAYIEIAKAHEAKKARIDQQTEKSVSTGVKIIFEAAVSYVFAEVKGGQEVSIDGSIKVTNNTVLDEHEFRHAWIVGAANGKNSPETVGVKPSERCENGYCYNKATKKDGHPDVKDWNDKTNAPLTTDERRKRDEACKKKPGTKDCEFRPAQNGLDPLAECVDKETKAHYDSIGRTRTFDMGKEELSSTMKMQGVCSKKGKDSEDCKKFAFAKIANIDFEAAQEKAEAIQWAQSMLTQFGTCIPQHLGKDFCDKHHQGLISRVDESQILEKQMKSQLEETKEAAQKALDKACQPTTKNPTDKALNEGYSSIASLLKCRQEAKPSEYSADGKLKPMCIGSQTSDCRPRPVIPGIMPGNGLNPVIPSKISVPKPLPSLRPRAGGSPSHPIPLDPTLPAPTNPSPSSSGPKPFEG